MTYAQRAPLPAPSSSIVLPKRPSDPTGQMNLHILHSVLWTESTSLDGRVFQHPTRHPLENPVEDLVEYHAEDPVNRNPAIRSVGQNPKKTK